MAAAKSKTTGRTRTADHRLTQNANSAVACTREADPRSQVGQDVTTDNFDITGSGTEPNIKDSPQDIPYQGDNTAHQNRPPFYVLAFICRVAS